MPGIHRVFRPTARRAALVLALMSVLGLAAGPIGTAAASSIWTIDATPNPWGPFQGHALVAVASFSPTDAWSIMQAGDHPTGLLHWDGAAWTQVESPSPGTHRLLYAVGGSSATDVWVVGWSRKTGQHRAMTLHWDGHAWASVPAPGPRRKVAEELFSVSATSRTDAWAIGRSWDGVRYKSLVLHWDGSVWKRVSSPNPGDAWQGTQLASVDARSRTDAWIVGTYWTPTTSNLSLILHWNGHAWKKVASPNPGGRKRSNYLSAVSATSSRDAWAVGTYAQNTPTANTRPLLLHWDGKAWTKAPLVAASSLDGAWLLGVTAIPGNAWAVGWSWDGHARRTLVLRWNGSRWVAMASPNSSPTQSNELHGVAAETASSVIAVGTSVADNGANRTLAMECC